ncbi:hypothetical protein AVEN_157319-1 [Araneus ventricosus]|uniref:Uncharacterized protein n=1 Tax=Araneus ventricosus TaxID=182803 RepID=A0A4Y2NU54_ARAVE|nr:hypothetical protein AVEN_157319-1 [Araneus ventricosus]
MQKEEYEEWLSIGEDIPVAATLTDLEIFQSVCEQDQAIKVDDSGGDECVEETPPTNAEMRQAVRVYSGTPGWVGLRTLTTKPNPTWGARIDPLIFRNAACSIVQQIFKKTVRVRTIYK